MMATTETLLLNNLTVGLRRTGTFTTILRDVSLSVGEGEIVGIVGESGAGKSTLAKAIVGLLSEGTFDWAAQSMVVGGFDMIACSGGELQRARGKNFSMVFQEPMRALNPTKKIGRQLMDVILVHDRLRGAHAEAKALQALAEVNVDHPARVMRLYPFELSGGMRQRVLIAMAISCTPRLIVADEPTTALDVTVQASILGAFKKLARDRKLGILFISHDLAAVSQLCDRVFVLFDGQILEAGITEDVLSHPRHPYTRHLINCQPGSAARDQRFLLRTEDWTPPGEVEQESCRYSGKCPISSDACRESPQLSPDAGSGHSSVHAVRCWHA